MHIKTTLTKCTKRFPYSAHKYGGGKYDCAYKRSRKMKPNSNVFAAVQTGGMYHEYLSALRRRDAARRSFLYLLRKKDSRRVRETAKRRTLYLSPLRRTGQFRTDALPLLQSGFAHQTAQSGRVLFAGHLYIMRKHSAARRSLLSGMSIGYAIHGAGHSAGGRAGA